jgi:molybdate transport system ATP-binding protein
MSLRVDGETCVGTFRLEAALEVGAGERVAVVGPNGSGKTTLLRVVAGLQPLARGGLELDGRILDAPADGAFVAPEARGVGLVFQDVRLLPHLSALDNVAFPLRAHGAARDVARRTAQAWLDRVGAAALARRRPRSLSGGEAQRVALARALAGEPRVLLLDEPFAAIDATSRAALRAEIATHLARFAGPTILVTHELADAAALEARVVDAKDGVVRG